MYEKEHADSPVSDDDIINTITAYNVAVGKYSKLLRKLLPRFGGYECKEPESGKFTLAFRCALLVFVKQQDGRLLLMRLSITAAMPPGHPVLCASASLCPVGHSLNGNWPRPRMVAGIAHSPSAVKGGPASGPACLCKQLQDAASF